MMLPNETRLDGWPVIAGIEPRIKEALQLIKDPTPRNIGHVTFLLEWLDAYVAGWRPDEISQN